VGARFVPNPAPAVLESQIYPNAERVAAAARRTLDWATAKASGRG
jgi:acetoin:2,6-dichlorophenolindophenol oxidoreductase subunit beta